VASTYAMDSVARAITLITQRMDNNDVPTSISGVAWLLLMLKLVSPFSHVGDCAARYRVSLFFFVCLFICLFICLFV
jgi:hypothetical protein